MKALSHSVFTTNFEQTKHLISVILLLSSKCFAQSEFASTESTCMRFEKSSFENFGITLNQTTITTLN